MTFYTGDLNIEQLNAILLAIPMDLTFTDENDIIIMFVWQEKRGINYIENNWGIEQRPCWKDTSNVFHP